MHGHNIGADGWAGVANPHPHPTPHPTPFPSQTHTQKASKTLIFPLCNSCSRTNRRMDGWMDGWTKSHRVACSQLNICVRIMNMWFSRVVITSHRSVGYNFFSCLNLYLYYYILFYYYLPLQRQSMAEQWILSNAEGPSGLWQYLALIFTCLKISFDTQTTF